MKKLIMMCVVVAAAISANAATFSWGGAICAEDGATALSGGETAYLLFSDTAFGTINSFNSSTMTTDAGGTMVKSHTITSGEAGNYAFSEKYDNSDYTQMNGYYAMILVNGSDMYYSTFQVTEFTSATTPTQDYKLNADWSGTDFLGDPSRKGTVTGGGIPEPTSGLLLLIGGAMLALRRKQK